MTLRPDIQAIVDTLQDLGVIEQNSQVNEEMKGTTDGLVYILTVNKEAKYVLKVDRPQSISCAELLLATYPGSSLLPKLLYTDPYGNFILYTYTAGTTHYKRGAKIDWLTGIVTGLLNHYETSSAPQWGRLEMPRDSWAEFNRISLEEARSMWGTYCLRRIMIKYKPCPAESPARRTSIFCMAIQVFIILYFRITAWWASLTLRRWLDHSSMTSLMLSVPHRMT